MIKEEHFNYENISIEELNDIFYAHLTNQRDLPPFPSSFSSPRNKIVQWLIQICKKLYLKPETMHRTICMFDACISLNKKQSDPIDITELKFTLVACLSISTKLNELNANYIKFFTDQLLNPPNSPLNSKRYSYEELSLAEMSLVSLLDYNINAPNVYHFNSIFVRICLLDNDLQQTKAKDTFISLNLKVLNSFLLTDYVVQLSPVNSAIMVLNETLMHFYQDKNCVTPQLIINKIQKMLLVNNQKENQRVKMSKGKNTNNNNNNYIEEYCNNKDKDKDKGECTPNISIESSSSTKIED